MIKKLLHDWMLVELEPEQNVSRGGIIMTKEEPVRTAKILSTGPGRYYGSKFIPTEAKIGDRVVFFKALMETQQGKILGYHLEDNQGLIRESDVLFAVEGNVQVTL